MNPDDRPRTLSPDRVEWVPSSPDAIEVRVFGTWHGSTVPPPTELVLGARRVFELGSPPGDDVPPAWSAAFLVPVESRSAVEAGDASLDVAGMIVGLPPATPGRMVEPESELGTLIDPAVLAERRARRAEIAEESASERAASAEQEASTLRTQLENIEERLVRAAEERDSLASRVADAERRLRLAEQREEAERRRRGELEEELAAERRSVEQELRELSDRLASAEEVRASLERELATVRGREEAERAAREHVDEQLRVALQRVSALEGASGDEAEELRRQAAILADRLAQAEAEHARLESVASDLEALRARLTAAEGATGEIENLRDRLADAERERDELRSQVEGRDDSAELDALRAEIAELRRRLDETLAALDHERAAHAATERARQLAVQRTREAREAAGQGRGGTPSERERELAEQVHELQREIATRAETHERVQGAIEVIRDELARVRAQVGGARSEPQVEALSERVRLLEDVLRSRDAELEVARADLADAQRAAEQARASGAATADTLRVGFESRIAELTAAVAEMRERLRETTSEFERRLAEERSRRQAAEAALAALEASTPRAEAAPPASAAPPEATAADEAAAEPVPDVGDDALESLIAGLRRQVESAREQLRDSGDEPRMPEPPSIAEPRTAPPIDEPHPAERPSIDQATRQRLRAIEADIRATVPDPEASVPAREIISSLQQAADRLRAAAEEEIAHAEADDAGPQGPRDDMVGGPDAAAVAPEEEHAASTPPAELGSRAIDFGAAETPWLRTSIERLAQSDPAHAADLLVALLPVQAMAGIDLTYVLTAPTLGPVRVTLAGGIAQVERQPVSLDADAQVSGSIATLAPLVAGAGGRWVKGVRIEGAKRPVKKLLRRRRPVGLGDFALITPQPPVELVLRALVSAVEPAWTRGHRFGVSYEIAGERWTVVADDGIPLDVRDSGEPHAATVILPREALLPVLQGAASTATVAGDRRAVDVLHAWFDRARGVAAG